MSLAAMKLALEALIDDRMIEVKPDSWEYLSDLAIDALSVAINHAERPQTHNEECWRWHHQCAVARIERGIE